MCFGRLIVISERFIVRGNDKIDEDNSGRVFSGSGKSSPSERRGGKESRANPTSFFITKPR